MANSHTAMNPISSLASPISLENRASRQLTELSPLRHVACLEDDMLPRSVLVVDDNHLVCWGLSRSLADQDLLVRTVGTGADAISHVQEDHYGLVFLDVRLPDANGFDVLREIRRISPETRVIIISADGTEGNRLKALAEGAMGLLEKPFNITDVNEVIRRAYTRKSR